MGNKKLDLNGKVFGRLVVIREDNKRSNSGDVKWVCSCTCGKEVSIIAASLKSGHTQSCGCFRKEKMTSHGLHKHPLYRVYMDMKSRCNNKKDTGYARYGGKGVSVCDRWQESFENFYEDVEENYMQDLQLDRIDNDKGYSKENCRWVTHSQNQMNKGASKNSSSKYKGVHWDKKASKWMGQIGFNGNSIYLGYFTCEKEAALAYNKKAKELFGKYAYLNKIED